MESKSRVVLIHGNRDVRRKLASGLARMRFEVFEAEGRADGLALIYQVRPVVIFLEVDIARKETWEMCSRIRLFTNTPMVLLATSDSGAERDALTADNVVVVEPPISVARALSAANALLNPQVDRGSSARPGDHTASTVDRATDLALQDQLTWLTALLSRIKRASSHDQILDSIVLNHLLGVLQADWVALYRTGRSRPASLSEVECLLWPGRNGWAEEYDEFFGKRAAEAIGAQRLIVPAAETGEEPASAEQTGAAVSIGDYVIMPLMGRQRAHGALAVIRGKDRAAFTRVQVQFINTVGEALGLAMDNADLVRQIREAAIVDSQTGMFSNAYLERIVRMETERRNRYGRPFSLVLLDWATGELDGLQAQTHLARKLEKVATVVQKQLRATDVVARRGDKGIALVLPETDSAQAQRVADRLMRPVRAAHAGHPAGKCPEPHARISSTLDNWSTCLRMLTYVSIEVRRYLPRKPSIVPLMPLEHIQRSGFKSHFAGDQRPLVQSREFINRRARVPRPVALAGASRVGGHGAGLAQACMKRRIGTGAANRVTRFF